MKNLLIIIVLSHLILGCNSATKQDKGNAIQNQDIKSFNDTTLQQLLTPQIESEKPNIERKHSTKSLVSFDDLPFERCNVLIVSALDRNLGDTISDQMVEKFLYTFSDSCSNNAEYSQYSNKILFELLSLYPSKTIEVLTSAGNIKIDYILNQVSQPVSDDIELNKILKKVLEQEKGDSVRLKLIKSLELAIDKYN